MGEIIHKIKVNGHWIIERRVKDEVQDDFGESLEDIRESKKISKKKHKGDVKS